MDPTRSDDVTSESAPDSESSDDAALLSAWKGGDTRAGHDFYARHGPRIKRYFRRKVGAMEDVADLVQDTFLRCQRAKYRGEGAMGAYLLGIAHRVFMEFLRDRARYAHRMDDERLLEQPVADLIDDPEYLLVQAQEKRVLMKAMRRIPLRYQLVLEMSRWEELTQAEIAAILHRPAPTIGRWKSEAIVALEGVMLMLSNSLEIREATTMTIGDWRSWLHAHAREIQPSNKSTGKDACDDAGE
jgi:RNA polymerase sigma factor (sigma-70 family)